MKKVELHNIIIQPVITEKTNEIRALNKYVFRIDRRANKDLVVRALQSMYDVEIVKCNIMNVRGKKKRTRYRTGMTPAWKKAVVTLKQGQSFPFFEGV